MSKQEKFQLQDPPRILKTGCTEHASIGFLLHIKTMKRSPNKIQEFEFMTNLQHTPSTPPRHPQTRRRAFQTLLHQPPVDARPSGSPTVPVCKSQLTMQHDSTNWTQLALLLSYVILALVPSSSSCEVLKIKQESNQPKWVSRAIFFCKCTLEQDVVSPKPLSTGPIHYPLSTLTELPRDTHAIRFALIWQSLPLDFQFLA